MAEYIDIVLTGIEEEGCQLDLFIQDDNGNEIPTNYFLDFWTESDILAPERRIRIQHDDVEKL